MSENVFSKLKVMTATLDNAMAEVLVTCIPHLGMVQTHHGLFAYIGSRSKAVEEFRKLFMLGETSSFASVVITHDTQLIESIENTIISNHSCLKATDHCLKVRPALDNSEIWVVSHA